MPLLWAPYRKSIAIEYPGPSFALPEPVQDPGAHPWAINIIIGLRVWISSCPPVTQETYRYNRHGQWVWNWVWGHQAREGASLGKGTALPGNIPEVREEMYEYRSSWWLLWTEIGLNPFSCLEKWSVIEACGRNDGVGWAGYGGGFCNGRLKLMQIYWWILLLFVGRVIHSPTRELLSVATLSMVLVLRQCKLHIRSGLDGQMDGFDEWMKVRWEAGAE